MRLQHWFNALSKLRVETNDFIEASHDEQKSLLDSPVRVAASCNSVSILLHVVCGKSKERHKVVWLCLSLFGGLELANELHQFDCGYLGHVNCLHDIHLLADVLDRVISKELLVTVGNTHERDGCFIQDVLNER